MTPPPRPSRKYPKINNPGFKHSGIQTTEEEKDYQNDGDIYAGRDTAKMSDDAKIRHKVIRQKSPGGHEVAESGRFKAERSC